jgi:putative ABC transport system permease protein
MINPEIVEGRWLLPNDGNALVVNTDFMDDEPDLNVGDEVVLELNSRDTTWQIVGVVQGTMFGSTVYANEPYFSRLTGNVGKSNVVRLSLANPTEADPDMLTQTLQDQFADAGLEPQRVMSLSQMQAMMETTFNFLISFLLAMAVVLAAVGGLGLSGTMSINVLERVREIGVMRAIGASDSAVLRLVLVEGIIIGIISWFAGAIIAVPLSLVISNLLGISLISQPLTYAYSIMGLGLWLVVAIILAAVASFFPARNASQLTVREVLAYE